MFIIQKKLLLLFIEKTNSKKKKLNYSWFGRYDLIDINFLLLSGPKMNEIKIGIKLIRLKSKS